MKPEAADGRRSARYANCARVGTADRGGNHDYGPKGDYGKANFAFFGSYQKNPIEADYTWHHHQDMSTMLLVPYDLHKIAHSGGVSVIKWLAKLKMKKRV